MEFKLHSPYSPAGDQPQAIELLTKSVQEGARDQVLLGVTGSGKTFTIANVIQNVQKPTLIMTHNKTLAAQIYQEMKNFFPENAVEYFVSYYDYYQPEAYVPYSDTYIEKTSSINEEIDQMRHSATRSLLERRDVIIVASVSCIYGLGPIESYSDVVIKIKIGDQISPQQLSRRLADIQYQRNDLAFERGAFRSTGDSLEIFPSHLSDSYWRISFFGDEVDRITEIEYPSRNKKRNLTEVHIYSNSHYAVTNDIVAKAIDQIQKDLETRVQEFEKLNKEVEKQRLIQRVQYDIEMMRSTGSCSGIENYSRYLSGRLPGEPPPTLLEYLPKDSLLVVDESHVTLPQIRGMYTGDHARKLTLSEYGFRLPSCADNRPLKFEEWNSYRPQTIYMSATPQEYELNLSKGRVAEQIVRPTGVLDPEVEIKSCDNQVDDLMGEIKATTEKGYRSLVTTLTKKQAEALTEYYSDQGMKVIYMHSDTDTLDRIEIVKALKAGDYDVLVGINLLREGLDIPECALVGILDADKEGFLRSATSLIQTIGRASRNKEGRVIMYADRITPSIKTAAETTRSNRQNQKNAIKSNKYTKSEK